MKKIFVLILVFVLGSCTSDPNAVPPEFLNDPFFYFNDSDQVRLNVYYEPDAAPFVGGVVTSDPDFNEVWDLTDINLTEIFSFRSQSPNLNIPRELSQMNMMADNNRDIWTVQDIVDLAQEQDVISKNQSESVFSIFFVRGFFEQNGQVSQNIIGVNVSGTSIVMIFKDVIEAIQSAGGPISSDLLQKFSEQATVIHEVGHALGLVDRGVPATGNHFDGLNGAHSNEEECIMFHLNQGTQDLLLFLSNLSSTGDATIWGPGVLSDVEAFSN